MRFLFSLLSLAVPMAVSSADTNPIAPNIIGGEQAAPGDHPYYVQWAGCGGSLIYPDIVLTAAHCIRAYPTEKYALVGAYERNSNSNGAVFRTIETLRAHPKYHAKDIDYDYGVIKLDEPVYTHPTLPVNFDADAPVEGDILTAIGLGYMDVEGGYELPQYLREVDLLLFSNERCESDWEEYYNAETMICAGVEDGNKSSCNGDSGGPIMDQNGTQVGIASYGPSGCISDEYLGVYARTSGAADWIQNQICALSANPPDDCVATETPTAAPTTTIPIRLTLDLDAYPEETSLNILRYPSMELIASYGNFTEPYSTVVMEFTVISGVDFLLHVHDTEGDGICCSYGLGKIKLEAMFDEGSMTLFFQYGYYSDALFEIISVPNGYEATEAPTFSPTEFTTLAPTMTPEVCEPLTANGTCVHFSFFLDAFPYETSVVVTDSDTGDIVWEKDDFQNSGSYDASVDLVPGDYIFQAFDIYGDGNCCFYGEGYFEVYAMNDDGTEDLLLYVNGDFGESTSSGFTVPQV